MTDKPKLGKLAPVLLVRLVRLSSDGRRQCPPDCVQRLPPKLAALSGIALIADPQRRRVERLGATRRRNALRRRRNPHRVRPRLLRRIAPVRSRTVPRSVRVIEPVVSLFINKNDFQQVCRQYSEDALKVLAVGWHGRHLMSVVEAITFGSVTQRLARNIRKLDRIEDTRNRHFLEKDVRPT